jgi:alkanesulfonate monooxygenase SsuD/methylene tetrahydromethanopterin reductase-like flavin-dependent oxidoreductase (luciferase family)
MKYGVQLAMGAAVCGRQPLQEVAALAEELEYDSILMGDHIVIPKRSIWKVSGTDVSVV